MGRVWGECADVRFEQLAHVESLNYLCGSLQIPYETPAPPQFPLVCPARPLRLRAWLLSVRLVVRMYHRLLTIKAADKAYVRHTSDSLIKKVVAYYEDDGDKSLLPEAYYYAGRVYRDLGDAPQALDYFEQAADALPLQGQEVLAGKIYSQTGSLFFYQQMYDSRCMRRRWRCSAGRMPMM